jgi:SAM-dependent methyltransferase
MCRLKIENNPTPYDIENKVESFHWWFVVRKKFLRSVVSAINARINGFTLDIGCGAGSNLGTLRSAGLNVIGLDHSTYALTLVRNKWKFPLLTGDLNRLPFKTKSVGLIIAMDILEHLDDDAKGIQESYRVLRNGGMLLLTVPAFKALWGTQDVVTGHKRRYSKKEIMERLRKENFNILRCSYFNFLLFFPILFARRIVRLLGLQIGNENEINSPLINFFLKIIFSLEVHLWKYFPFPFGVSIFILAQKNEP